MRLAFATSLCACLCLCLYAEPAGAQTGDSDPCVAAAVQPAASDATDLNEIAPSARRPTFDVPLGDGSSRDDQITLPPKSGTRFSAPLDIGADLIDTPASDTSRLDGTIKLGAAVNSSRTRVVVSACVRGV